MPTPAKNVIPAQATQAAQAAAAGPPVEDWRSAEIFRIVCVTSGEGAPFALTDAMLHPALSGFRVETLPAAEAERRLAVLLDPLGPPDLFPVVVADLGPDTLAWCRAQVERHPGDHWHCLALSESRVPDPPWPAGLPAALDVLPNPPRADELTSHLRYLARVASERARRAAAERELLGMGRRLDETQGQLRLARVLEEAVARLQRLSTTDGLTGITNRASFEERLDLEWGRAVGESFPLSVILIDIDYFKRYNDSYGHLLGDACLQKVARSLLAARESSHDQVARFGGEEFVVLLPGRTPEAALEAARSLRAAVEALAIPNANSGVSPHVTISAGVATAVPDLTSSAADLVQRADRALYQAKREGRNRVVADA